MLSAASIFLIPYIFSFLLSAWVTIYCWRLGTSSGARYYSSVSFFQALWTFGYIIELLSPTLEGKVFWDDFQFIGTVGWRQMP